MGIYYGTQQVKPSGIASVWVGNNKVYEAGGTKSVVESIIDGSITSLDLSQTDITAIESRSLSYCPNLVSIDLPNTITKMHGNNVNGDTSLVYINFNGTLEEWCSVQNAASWNRTNDTTLQLRLNGVHITNVIIPDSITTLTNVPFNGFDIVSLTINEHFTSLTTFAINTPTLTTLTMLPTTPPTLSSTLSSSITTIYVPSASLSDYQTATGWSSYASKMVGV